MRELSLPLVPAVLGLVLGPMGEQQLRRALAIAEGDVTVLVTRPLSAALLATAVLLLVAPWLVARWRRGADAAGATP
jgi:putative tricarboxylic transport membrane protein